MFSIISLLLPVLSKIPGMFGDYFKRELKVNQAQHELRMARLHEETQLQGQVVKANLERGTQQLKATSKFFKYFTFILWFGPFATAFVAPTYSIELFARLAQLPDWYVQSCMVIIFAIWGISSSRDTIANIFSGLSTFMLNRQRNKLNIKLQKGTVLPPSESNLPSNKDWGKDLK